MQVELSVNINVAPGTAVAVYLNYRNWHKLFPLTIRSAKYIREENGVLTVKVDHKKEGFVINILKVINNEEIKLEEFKPKYNATFINRFQKIAGGTRYTVIANVSLKSFYKLIGPFIKSIVEKRIRKFVLDPMKEFLERKQTVNNT
jgi:hypothetical protein